MQIRNSGEYKTMEKGLRVERERGGVEKQPKCGKIEKGAYCTVEAHILITPITSMEVKMCGNRAKIERNLLGTVFDIKN